MKTCSSHHKSNAHLISGFTLVEMMIAVGIFSLVILAVVNLQIFAMRSYTTAATKLSATTDGRETMNAIRDNVRAAKNVYVGTYNNGSFLAVANGSPQEGNALEIAFTNNAATNLIYYLYVDANVKPTNILYSVMNGVQTPLAKYVTNYDCFYAEDYQGNVLLNYLNNPVIHVVLQFSQWEYPIGVIGGSNLNSYDFYTLRSRITRRSKQ